MIISAVGCQDCETVDRLPFLTELQLRFRLIKYRSGVDLALPFLLASIFILRTLSIIHRYSRVTESKKKHSSQLRCVQPCLAYGKWRASKAGLD